MSEPKPKRKKSKRTQEKEELLFRPPEGYEDYVKDHSKRLRRLEREASGRNMEEPYGEY